MGQFLCFLLSILSKLDRHSVFLMTSNQSPERIKEVAMEFDNAITNKDIDSIMDAFAYDCEIELLGITLYGLDGVKKWVDWLYTHIDEIDLEPVIIMVEDDIFFEEFIVHAKLKNGKITESKQSEVLIYEDYKIKSLRLYFDRLDFSASVVEGFIGKSIVNKLIKKTVEGLV